MSVKNLSQSDIDEIKRLLDDGTEQVLIAKRFGITQSDVSQIKTGRKYERRPDFSLPLLSRATREIIRNIAANKGLRPNEYLKHEILKIVDNTPDHFKRPPLEY